MIHSRFAGQAVPRNVDASFSTFVAFLAPGKNKNDFPLQITTYTMAKQPSRDNWRFVVSYYCVAGFAMGSSLKGRCYICQEIGNIHAMKMVTDSTHVYIWVEGLTILKIVLTRLSSLLTALGGPGTLLHLFCPLAYLM